MAIKKKLVKRIVLVRSAQSGVWIGEFFSRKGQDVTLKNARKIWRWRGANTTSELAMNGCDSHAFTRVAEPTKKVIVFLCCELHDSNEAAEKRIAACRWAM